MPAWRRRMHGNLLAAIMYFHLAAALAHPDWSAPQK
jgi:hypothetical protein